ncbi:MAG: hypothetical protein RBR35_05190 [Salinivirgaceae bacterium]|nr:hypothetical protein [Salinivirgaceae bacterium]
MNFSKSNPNNISLDQLVGNLRNEDHRYSRISRSFQIVYWSFIPLYTIVTILHYSETKEFNALIGGACFVASFVIFAIFFGKFHKEYKSVDYSLPTLTMLKAAAYRYKPFPLRTIWIFLAVLFMDGYSFVTYYCALLVVGFSVPQPTKLLLEW